MNTFSPAFSQWLDTHSHSLRAVAIDAGIANGELSRIRTGAKNITFDSLTRLLPAIERLSTRSHARALLVAYLHDETPTAYEPDVRIYAIDDTSDTVDKDAITLACERFEKHARADADFARMWLTLDGYIHEPDAIQVDARTAAHTGPDHDAEEEPPIALLAEPLTPYNQPQPPSKGRQTSGQNAGALPTASTEHR